MEYKQKYLKYKQKYNELQKKNLAKNLWGGSYIIDSDGVVKNLIEYPEVSILLEDKIGEGGSGSVKLGTIIECKRDVRLIGKKVAIKEFKRDYKHTSEEKKNYEKQKLVDFGLDYNEHLIETEYYPSLYFDIMNGPLKNQLVFEYAGNTLCNYIREKPEIYNINNNRRIMLQLFKILFELAKKDNMQNDIKCENIVYKVNFDNSVDVKLIDFGSSMSISELNAGKVNFGNRTNMNTPETIYNYLLHNKNFKSWAEQLNLLLNNFNRWYYYPFISIVYFLYAGQEYSTGNNSNGYIHNNITADSKEKWKQSVFYYLSENQNIIDNIDKLNIPGSEKIFLNELIDMICIPEPRARASEETVIDFLSKKLE